LEQVYVSESIGYYVVDLVEATRRSPRTQVGASPRGALALFKLARARAALDARDYVIPEDIKSVAVPALAHRLTLRPELWVERIRQEDVVAECLESVPAPSAEDVRRP
jgi:MoxR-like ATPase